MSRRFHRWFFMLLVMLLAAALCGCSEQTVAEKEPENVRMEILCPNLGKADGFLFISEGHAVLLDAGEDPEAQALLALMDERNITRLDAMILTHFDKDHIGGAAKILEIVDVGAVYRTTFTEESGVYDAFADALETSETAVENVSETVTFSSGSADFTLYPPLQEAYDKNQDNNSSLIVSVACGQQHLLFAGDAQKQRIREYLKEQYDGTAYDFLKVPHHGKDTKAFSLFLEEFVPEQVLITSSDAEPEDRDLLSLMREHHIDSYLTRKGQVNVCVTDKGIDITQ